jgi:hypothetical protein
MNLVDIRNHLPGIIVQSSGNFRTFQEQDGTKGSSLSYIHYEEICQLQAGW